MKNISTLVALFVFSIFSFSYSQFAMAASTAEVVSAAVEKSTEAEQAKINEAHKELETTGGKIVINRDGSVRVYPNGPTAYQRVVLTAAYVKDGIVYATTETYKGAKAADGAVVGVVTYPVAKIGEWLNKPAANTVAVETPVGTASVSVTPAK